MQTHKCYVWSQIKPHSMKNIWKKSGKGLRINIKVVDKTWESLDLLKIVRLCDFFFYEILMIYFFFLECYLLWNIGLFTFFGPLCIC